MFDIVQLTQAYTEPHRYYHTLDHITSMLTYASKEGLNLTPTQIEAIWWHDYVYDPKSKTNEEDSAEAMSKWASVNNAIRLNTASRIILDTKTHISTLDESKVVLDLDLMGLGSSWEQFQINTKNVRAEFCHLDEKTWITGRMKWIASFCDREYIFHTDHFREKFEAQARSNMSWEYVELDAILQSGRY